MADLARERLTASGKWYREWHEKWTFEKTSARGTLEDTDIGSAMHPRARAVLRFPGAQSEEAVMNVRKRWQTSLLAWTLLATMPAPAVLAQQDSDASSAKAQQAPKQRDGRHDFDFEIGTWKTHLSRLVNPLSGSTTWVEYEGTSVVRKVWNGLANLVELEAEGPAGRFQGLNLRLYNPQSRQWSLTFANANSGILGPPAIGEFRNGRGEFYSQETLNGRSILVRFVISNITADSCRFEQAFSDDGGKTWEVNWIAVDTRVKEEAGKGR
jgi:hypothetical protein